jgi:hypothetical protein
LHISMAPHRKAPTPPLPLAPLLPLPLLLPLLPPLPLLPVLLPLLPLLPLPLLLLPVPPLLPVLDPDEFPASSKPATFTCPPHASATHPASATPSETKKKPRSTFMNKPPTATTGLNLHNVALASSARASHGRPPLNRAAPPSRAVAVRASDAERRNRSPRNAPHR